MLMDQNQSCISSQAYDIFCKEFVCLWHKMHWLVATKCLINVKLDFEFYLLCESGTRKTKQIEIRTQRNCQVTFNGSAGCFVPRLLVILTYIIIMRSPFNNRNRRGLIQTKPLNILRQQTHLNPNNSRSFGLDRRCISEQITLHNTSSIAKTEDIDWTRVKPWCYCR